MRKIVVILTVSFLGLVIQSALIKGIFPTAFVPDILVIVAVYLALQGGGAKALIACFLLGLLADLAAGVYLGPQAGGYVLSYFVTTKFSKAVFADRGFGISFLAFFAAIAKSATALTIHLSYLDFNSSALPGRFEFVGITSQLSDLGIGLFLEAFLTALIAVPLFYLIMKLVGGHRYSGHPALSADVRVRRWAKQA